MSELSQPLPVVELNPGPKKVSNMVLVGAAWLRVRNLLHVVQAMVALPAFVMLPAWWVAMVLGVVGLSWWRGRHRQRQNEALWPFWWPALLVIVLPGTLLWSGQSPLDLAFYIALAYLGGTLKLLELRTYRDVLWVTFMALFVLAVFFLLEQGMLYTLFVAVGTSLCLGALVHVHAPLGLPWRAAWQQGGRALLWALPMMLLLFVFFPRLPPLWSMPLPQDQARSGISSTMAPGDIADLAMSNALAFRAEFSGAAPLPDELYWRVLTLTHYDGRRWYQSPAAGNALGSALSSSSVPLQPVVNSVQWQYELLLEPTGQPWVPVLENLISFSAEARRLADQRLLWHEPINMAQRLTGIAAAEVIWQESPEVLAQALQLPDAGITGAANTRRNNPRTHALAAQLSGAADTPQAYVTAVREWFLNQPFRYTLQPGAMLGPHTIDDFLLRAQSGFCAHFAEAFVFLMRAAGIPARVVVGYQGGQLSSDERYWRVRQRDAHAWAEVWLGGAWVRIDPTAWVAPERIQGSMTEELLALDEREWWSASASPLWQRLFWRWDRVQYQWQRWVVNFSAADRQGWGFLAWFKAHAQTVAIISAILFLSVFGTWYIARWRRENNNSRTLRRLEHQARTACLRCRPDLPENEGLTHWAIHLRGTHPELAQDLAEFAQVFLALCYGRPSNQQGERLRTAREYLQHLQRRVKHERNSR
ncbi:transglutaminaseTgpA domain-containing protein [Salinispirillum marinum]|uniref:TransglutaminaseTgpA domain-containing protein n=2 Tax=Saccharospirillaceae TaxID=255527 RepID=A0ABV8BDC1_9GAMM